MVTRNRSPYWPVYPEHHQLRGFPRTTGPLAGTKQPASSEQGINSFECVTCATSTTHWTIGLFQKMYNCCAVFSIL